MWSTFLAHSTFEPGVNVRKTRREQKNQKRRDGERWRRWCRM